jgi:putative transposase
MEYRKQGHCVYYTQYHLVITSKYRRKVFKKGIGQYLKIILNRVTEHYPELSITVINTDKDHAHLMMSVPPKMSVSDAVRIIKANSATALRNKFKFLDKVYWGVPGIWSDGYFVSTVGIDEETIQRYIERQGREDSGQAKLVL